ncbi:UNVERIFIED_CONTAM: Pentatricopeptide repeat-containing protein, mitochondrial [Sesamum calycinum]|uniref:Pentatricopeptide repeat-containing protein, mitochondrial n=1 Tax=Sesamum calycinum TaxID=2727403 RepID=A0AAW2SEA8_9LAMI
MGGGEVGRTSSNLWLAQDPSKRWAEIFFLLYTRKFHQRCSPKPFLDSSKLSPFHPHTLSLLPKRNKPKKHYDVTARTWNTTHRFVLANPTLSILETKCKSMVHLKQVQSQMIVTGLCLDRLAYSRLIAFSALSPMGDLNYSKRLLFAMQNPNAFSWNIVIRAICDGQNPSEAFLLYKEMLAVVSVNGGSLRPDNYTFPLLFKTCAKLLFSRMGYEILGHVLKMNYDGDIFVHNALIHFLVSCGELQAANKVFEESCVRDLVSWNSLINGYTRSGRGNEALRIYREMQMGGYVDPDEVTMIGVVTACTQLEDLKLGREFHWYIRERGLNMNVPLANALLDMYVKCGDLEEANELFERMEEKTMKDVVPWNAMISAYVQAGRGKEALSLFHEMQAMKVEPDEVTMVSCLSACAKLGALDVGIWIHHYIEKHNLLLNVVLGTALVDIMLSWRPGGRGPEDIFSDELQVQHFPPNQAGLLKEAIELLESMPMKADAVVWGAMFFACRIHKNIELGEKAAMKLLDLDPDDSGIYVLLANMYVEANMWDKAGEVRKMMRREE